jgi:hypothetical protein
MIGRWDRTRVSPGTTLRLDEGEDSQTGLSECRLCKRLPSLPLLVICTTLPNATLMRAGTTRRGGFADSKLESTIAMQML